MSEERVFFRQGEITVTNARLIVGSQTFAMRNITSVQMKRAETKNPIPGYLMLFGIIVAIYGFAKGDIPFGITGAAILAAGIYWAWTQEDTFIVELTTSAGEVSAYQSTNKKLISDIVAALNDSIVTHG